MWTGLVNTIMKELESCALLKSEVIFRVDENQTLIKRLETAKNVGQTM